MNFKSSFLFAKRILFPKSGRSSIATKSLFGSVLCIGISLIPLVAVLTVSNGMIEGITGRLISLSSSHLEAVSFKKNADSLDEARAAVLELPQITAAYPMVNFSALATANSKRCGISVRALPADVFKNLKSYQELYEAKDGSIQDFNDDSNGALVGQGIAEKLGLKAGDKIRLVLVSKNEGVGLAPSVKTFNVVGTVSCGYRELDALWLFMPYPQAKKLSLQNDAVFSLMCQVQDPFSKDLPKIQAALKKSLGSGYRVYRWDELNRSQYENFSSTKILLIFIQLLIVLVAAVNISSALVMLALERRREIAILKSLGATSKGVSLSFLMAGFSCGAGGLLLGIPLGLLFSVNINGIIRFVEKALNFVLRGLYFFANNDIMNYRQIHLLDEEYYLNVIPVNIPFGDLFLIGFATLLLSLAASLLPASKAGKERPLDTLRNSR
ncbi:MAG: ABC transporter permease [Treponema sp.]|nr:ABC transporter permease [Treponema sp.]